MTLGRPPLDLLAELVSIPSHVTQPDGIRAVGERVGAELAALGFDWLPAALAERRTPAWAERVLCPEVDFGQLIDPVVWHRRGAAAGTVLLLGDVDTALAFDACELTVRDGRAMGPAVADMKGGLVVLVEALLALEGRSAPSLTVVLSGDEQAGSLRSRATIVEHGSTASWCICLECARDGGKLMRSRGHIGVGLMTATGVEAHAGSALSDGINAITALARGLLTLQDVSAADATVTPTILSGGRRRSLIPASASAVLDVRARDAAAWSALEERMRAALESAGPGLDLDVFNHRPGLLATDHTVWFLDLVREVGASVAVEVDAIDSLAAGSSAFVDSTRIPVLDGMGPVGGGLMTADEYVEVASLATRGALLAATIERLGSVSGAL